MKIYSAICLSFAALIMSGCVALPAAGIAYVGETETRPEDLPPANTTDTIVPHESWCYETMGYAECYASAQDVDPNRLINVDPANAYPLTPQAYRDAAQVNPRYPAPVHP